MRFEYAEMVAPVYSSIFGITSNGTLSPSQPIVCNDDVPACNLTRVIMLSRFNRTPNVTHSGIIPKSSRGNLYITSRFTTVASKNTNLWRRRYGGRYIKNRERREERRGRREKGGGRREEGGGGRREGGGR